MAKPSANHQPLVGSQRPREQSHKLMGPVDATELISFMFLIRSPPGRPPLPDLEYWARTPLREQRFLTPDEFVRTYGATQADLDVVTGFVSAHGMTVLESHAGRQTVSVHGTAEQINSAFQIVLNRYEEPLPIPSSHTTPQSATRSTTVSTHIYHGFEGQVHLPTELAGIVTGVIGLDNRAAGAPAGVGSGDPPSAYSLTVPIAARMYNFPNVRVPDQTIGVLALQMEPGNGASYLSTDFTEWYFPSLLNPPATGPGYNTPPAAINDINVTVGTNTFRNNPAAVQAISDTSALTGVAGMIYELTQDISTSATVAQGATINVYFTERTEQGWVQFLKRVLVPAAGEIQPTVVTSSWIFQFRDDSGLLGSINDTASNASILSGLFQSLAAQGINFFSSAGDWGHNDGIVDFPGFSPHVGYPSSDPWITSCGGTIMAGTGNFNITAEYVWSDAYSNSPFGGETNSALGTTGGGVSQNFPIPVYQGTSDLPKISPRVNPDGVAISPYGRCIPDIAGMIAYNGFFVNGLGPLGFIGTSATAPLYAGLFAVLRSILNKKFGSLNTILYKLGFLQNTGGGPQGFNDVTFGNNDSVNEPAHQHQGWLAAPGWDACTGWGSINGTMLQSKIASML
jgi:kumamolisin